MKKLFFIIGASGAGKTTALKSFEQAHPIDFEYCYFDSIGVPTPEEMKEKFGSGEGWQKETTKVWVKKIKEEFLSSKPTILDGQISPKFIEEACIQNGITNYGVILFDCTDEKRSERLINRGHPELANEQMMNWARYLREESQKRGYNIVDNTDLNREQSVEILGRGLKDGNSELENEIRAGVK